MAMALAVQNEEEDVEAMLKRLGIVVDDRVDACLRFKSLGSMQRAMETLSAWATAHPEGKFALRKRSGMTKSRGVYTQRIVCTREGREPTIERQIETANFTTLRLQVSHDLSWIERVPFIRR